MRRLSSRTTRRSKKPALGRLRVPPCWGGSTFCLRARSFAAHTLQVRQKTHAQTFPCIGNTLPGCNGFPRMGMASLPLRVNHGHSIVGRACLRLFLLLVLHIFFPFRAIVHQHAPSTTPVSSLIGSRRPSRDKTAQAIRIATVRFDHGVYISMKSAADLVSVRHVSACACERLKSVRCRTGGMAWMRIWHQRRFSRRFKSGSRRSNSRLTTP